MNCLTVLGCDEWCAQRSIKVIGQKLPSYGFHQAKIVVEVPKTTQRMMDLAYALVSYDREQTTFSGALLWFTGWNIWSESIEPCAMKIWRDMRLAHGERRPLDDAPGHVFSAEEFLDLQSFFLIPLLFQWDAQMIPSHGEYFVSVSHDEVVELVPSTAEVGEKLFAYLHRWDAKKHGSQ